MDDKNTLSKKLGNEGAAAENEDDFSSLSQWRRGRGPLSSAVPRSGRKVAENVLGLAITGGKRRIRFEPSRIYFCTNGNFLERNILNSGSGLQNAN